MQIPKFPCDGWGFSLGKVPDVTRVEMDKPVARSCKNMDTAMHHSLPIGLAKATWPKPWSTYKMSIYMIFNTNYEQRYFLTAPNASTVLKETKILPIYILLYVSDLNRIRRETIKKRLVWLMGEFMREHEAVNSGCVKVRSLQYLQKWQMIVLIFLYRVL